MPSARQLALGLAGALLAGCSTWGGRPAESGSQTVETVCELTREPRPEGLSGISRISGDRYFSVDDRGGMLYELEIPISGDGEADRCRVVRSVRLDGRCDLEGCAADPLDGRVWVSDEHDHSIRQFDPATGRETDRVDVPGVFRENVRYNLSIEALTISPDGLRMYAANEDTMVCDGPVADRSHGGTVRIQEFVRTGRGCPWKASRQGLYRTEKVEGEPYAGIAISGVASMCALDDGTLLVLEREMSQKNPLFPTFLGRIFSVASPAADGAPVAKCLLWEENTMFANYEGMSRGPVLADGAQSLVLVSDGGGKAEEKVEILAVRRKVRK